MLDSEAFLLRYFLNGILIGVVFGVPIGAVGALSVRRSVEHGVLGGLVSGLGCSAADALYACLSVYGFTLVSPFLMEYQGAIGFVGGLVLVVFGICIAWQRSSTTHSKQTKPNLSAFFWSSFAIAASSPATIFMFLFAFSVFGVENPSGWLEGALLVVGITLGTCLWWVLLAGFASRFRARVTQSSLRVLNYACGTCIVAFGLFAAARPLLAQ